MSALSPNNVPTLAVPTLPTITLSHANSTCIIALHGGHILSYQRNGEERLFVSKQAVLDGSKAIRGGVPICWPWFGQLHPDIHEHGIAHGLLRNQSWQVSAQIATTSYASATLSPTDRSHPLWPTGLDVQLKVTLADVLTIELISTNHSDNAVTFTGALHTYFAIPDIAQIQLQGFSQAHRFTNNLNGDTAQWHDTAYTFAGEVDRIHENEANGLAETQILAEDFDRRINHQGHDSLVVWNPWIEKGQRLADLDDNEYRAFVCIETAVTKKVTLAPQAAHRLIQRID
jgi:glucose-6-phosphate 1-epimerase